MVAGAADGYLPLDWLAGAGRTDTVTAAWSRGALAEVPAGLAWDVVRLPLTLAPETVRLLRAACVSLGPVLVGPPGAEFIVTRGSAHGWATEGGEVLATGRLVLLPHPSFVDPFRLGDRGWLVGPTDHGLTRGLHLEAAYRSARAEADAAGAAL
ncbi:hypothetical protein [Streptomyces barkulensis]|uniref:hypothetical protein n=1 Tax=Streptomyces barkulensis TaxID=1257026 RepID=UPI0011803770|nr:hypothetical protein [Streptomyces barkulensis]